MNPLSDLPSRADIDWDAGDLGCGELLLELKIRLKRARPGSTARIVARDPGAPADLPAWCGLTGHRLVFADPPIYWIRTKEG